MNMFLDETSTLDTSYTASGLQFVIRLCTPNEYVHTGQAHANVCKLQIKRGITRCRLTPTFVFKRKFWKYVFVHLFLFLKIISLIIRLQLTYINKCVLQTDMKIKFHRKLSVQVLVYLYVREIFWQNWIVYTEKLFRIFVSYCRSKEKWILFVFLHIFGVVIHFIVKPFWIFCRQEETTRIARMFCAREIQNCFKFCQGLLCHEHVYIQDFICWCHKLMIN